MNPEEMKNLITMLGLGNPNLSNFSNINMPTQKDFTNMSAVEKLKNLPSLLQSKGIDPLMTGMTLLNAGGYSDQKQTPLQPITTALAGGRQAFQQNQQMQQQNLLNKLRLGTTLNQLNQTNTNNKIRAIFSNPDLKTDEKIKQASAIDPIITGKYVKSLAESKISSNRLNAMSGGNNLNNPATGLYDYAVGANVSPQLLGSIKNMEKSINLGLIDPLSFAGVQELARLETRVENSINRNIERIEDTERLGISKSSEERAKTGDTGNQSEAQAATFLVRMEGANKRINDPALDENKNPIIIDGQQVSIADVANKPEIFAKAAGILGSTAENLATSPNRQVYKNAAMDWITANLRKESGAVISEIEFARDFVKFFPQIGDSQQVIKAKQEARKNAEKGMRASAGKALKRLPNQNQTNTNNSQINVSEQDVREELERRKGNR